MREKRDQAAIDKTLKALKSAVESDSNLLSLILDAVKTHETLSEIHGVLREIFDEYGAPDIL